MYNGLLSLKILLTIIPLNPLRPGASDGLTSLLWHDIRISKFTSPGSFSSNASFISASICTSFHSFLSLTPVSWYPFSISQAQPPWRGTLVTRGPLRRKVSRSNSPYSDTLGFLPGRTELLDLDRPKFRLRVNTGAPPTPRGPRALPRSLSNCKFCCSTAVVGGGRPKTRETSSSIPSPKAAELLGAAIASASCWTCSAILSHVFTTCASLLLAIFASSFQFLRSSSFSSWPGPKLNR